MDELSKLKKIRGVTRASITRFINKLEGEFETMLDADQTNLLQQHFDYLTGMLKEIKSFDEKIQELIEDEKEFDAEIESAIEYSQKIIMWNSKISAQLKTLSCKTINSFDQNRPTDDRDNMSAGNNPFENSSVSQNINNSRTVKLPKLTIGKYYGDPCTWIEFWNQFENSIDKNETLTKIDKFSYLKSLLGAAAANVVNGFALSEENYDKALKLLKQRFGREELVINAHMSKLLNLDPVKDPNNVMGLRKLYDTCEVQIRSLESLNVTSGMYGHLLHPILIKLIPDNIALDFNRKRLDKLEDSEFDVMALLNFLKVEIECRESSNLFQNPRTDRRKNVVHHNSVSKSSHNTSRETPPRYQGRYSNKVSSSKDELKTHEYSAPVVENSCIFCNGSHNSEQCDTLSVDEKKEILKKQARCFLCLKQKHRIKDCKKKEHCDICNHKHNRSICYQLDKPSDNEENKVVSAVSHCNESTINNSVIKAHRGILLQTCTVVAKSPANNEPPSNQLLVRILLDNGSMRSFITKEVSQKLKLPVVRTETLSVYAFEAKQASERNYNVVRVRVENREQPSLSVELEVLETDQISATNIPSPEINISKAYKQLGKLKLADCYDYKEKEIALLIGADYYFNVVSGRIKRLSEKLVASDTIFGWCLQGQIGSNNDLMSMKIVIEDRAISEQLKEFWELENMGINPESDSKDIFDEEIMKDFEAGISYQNQRYKVKLPWKPQMKQILNNNEEVASRRFERLKNSFINDPFFFTEYKRVLDEYRDENIVEPLSCKKDIETEDNCFYLPHRAVIRDDKTTSRLRIVFDASSHAKGEVSLNDCLYTGLNLIPDLFLLLIRFRSNPIAITADIKKAFLQIEIQEEDRDFTRFYWDDHPARCAVGKDHQIFRMTRVLFGVKSSPFLLAATIKHHLKRYVDIFPHTSQLIDNSLYVDDLICGQENVEQALKTCLESYNIFKEASMLLRKWKTNSFELQNKLKELDMELDSLDRSCDQTLTPSKVLGVAWDHTDDFFYFNTLSVEKFLSKKVNTKRFLLQIAGRIFDPVGFIGPYTIRIKCLIQEIWCLGLDWDDSVPKETVANFNDWCNDLKELSSLRIPRYYLLHALPRDVDSIELHCFSDASKKAYGTVAYLRIRLKNGNIITSFVASKGRVAPLKTLSLPRLELMGALLSARLSDKIIRGLDFPVARFFWTDSSITYFWIKGMPDKFKVFVKNRIQEIHKYSNPTEWSHCPGKENPADFVSRGLSVTELKDCDLWWFGPGWLKQDYPSWPRSFEQSKESNLNQEALEIRKTSVLNTNVMSKDQNIDTLINQHSSFTKLVRITAYCLRFYENCKRKSIDRKTDSLSASELHNATKLLVKSVQLSEFYAEIKCLQNKQPIPKNSKILSLNVFLDEEELLRVGGRLKFSELTESQKHQLLLPKSHHLTQLIIGHFHKKSLHSGTQTTLSLLRQLYWIPSGQDRVRRVINKCMTCFRTKTQTLNQMMGDLPKDRVVPSRPFEKVGLDFAGPILTKPNLKRSKVILKSYIAIFICFCTKATHFEVVSDLSTESFLACLRRFISRRSKPSIIWSDNATNFKGAKNVLSSMLEICKSNPVQNFTAKEGIQWDFIPPASPHFGGLWEANIKSMKKLLLKVSKSNILNFEELTTLVTQIEAVLNSRPLSPLSADPNDFQPLTPGHFLVGGPIVSFPEPYTASDSFSFSSRWSLVQKLRNRFWSRWSNEYLSGLQTRAKWSKQQPNLKVGQLVLLKEPNKSPMEWSLARILQVYPGEDGLVRVADVKTSRGIFRRSVTKIAPLPFSEDVGQPSNGGRDAPE